MGWHKMEAEWTDGASAKLILKLQDVSIYALGNIAVTVFNALTAATLATVVAAVVTGVVLIEEPQRRPTSPGAVRIKVMRAGVTFSVKL